MWIEEPKKEVLRNKQQFVEKNSVCSMFKILGTYILAISRIYNFFVAKIRVREKRDAI